jgi:T5orf172 domain
MVRHLLDSRRRAGVSPLGFVYVLKIGESGNLYKVGKAKDHEQRRKALGTGSAEKLYEYALIESSRYSDIETVIKHRLQGCKWLGGEGREIYEVEEAELAAVLKAARLWDMDVLPMLAEAEKLGRQASDGTVLTPGEVERELYREAMRLRQVELTAKQERERIEAQLKLVMRAASTLRGIATWQSSPKEQFEETRFKKEHPELAIAYTKTLAVRPFKIRW